MEPPSWSDRLLPPGALFVAACTDFLAPVRFADGDVGVGFAGWLVFVTGFAGLLAAPILLLFLGLPTRLLRIAIVTQVLLGPLAFCAGGDLTRDGYLAVVGRPVSASVADRDRECHSGTVGPASDRPAGCADYLWLQRPNGRPVSGPKLGDGAAGMAAFATTSGPVEMIEDPLGLARAIPAADRDPATTRDWIVGVLLATGWVLLLGSLSAGLVAKLRLRGRNPRAEPESVLPS
ncbi:hypothetical protein [Actinoplanes sp. NPDC051859]|uniref:hypothetical protein n=1 Tax=Actinoplanes sp. NPDC051859 TaxID=3363909 RepID=UPI00379A00D0